MAIGNSVKPQARRYTARPCSWGGVEARRERGAIGLLWLLILG